MLAQITLLIVRTVFGFITLALLARFFMQWGRVSFRNPIGHFVIAATNWVVMPLRRFIPGLFGLDMASLLSAWIAQMLCAAIELSLLGLVAIMPGSIPLLGFIDCLSLAVWLVFGVVFVSALLSWFGPQAPMAHVFTELARPFLLPFRRLIPLIGGLDLSPLVLLLVLQIVQLVLHQLRMGLLMPPIF